MMSYGFYSAKAVHQGYGTSLYSTPNGKNVELTAVSKSPTGDDYNWDDKVCVGEVVAWVSIGLKSVRWERIENKKTSICSY